MEDKKRKVILDVLENPIAKAKEALMPKGQVEEITSVPKVDTEMEQFQVEPLKLASSSPSIDIGESINASMEKVGKGLKGLGKDIEGIYNKDPNAWMLSPNWQYPPRKPN